MPFLALASLSALPGRQPPAPKPGKLVAMEVPGHWPRGPASMRCLDGSGEGSGEGRGDSSGDACRAERPGGQCQATCPSVASATPLHSTSICAPQATPEDTPSMLKHFSGCETQEDKSLTFHLQGRQLWRALWVARTARHLEAGYQRKRQHPCECRLPGGFPGRVSAPAPLRWVAEPAAARRGTLKTCESTSAPLALRKWPQNNQEPAEQQGLKGGVPPWLL